MKARVSLAHLDVEVDFSQFYDLCIPVEASGGSPEAFFIPRAEIAGLKLGNWTGLKMVECISKACL